MHMGMGTMVTMNIKERLLTVFSLVLMTTILPEMLSGNTPAPVLFRADAFVFFTLAYGMPILVIREWTVRKGLSFGGIFMAGMAYSLINEGLIAKTIFRQENVPIDVFDHYGFALGVNFPWALYIAVWHAFSSVLLPIALTHLFFAKSATQPWLGKKTLTLLALATVTLSSLFFLNDSSTGTEGSLPMLAALWAVMALLALVGSRFGGAVTQLPNEGGWKPLAFGFAGFAPIIALLIVANLQAPPAAYFGLFALLALLWRFVFLRQGWNRLPAFAWFALGWYMQVAFFSWTVMFSRSPATVLCDAVALMLLGWLVWMHSKKVKP